MKRLRAFLVAAFLATAVLLPITATPVFASLSCPNSASQIIPSGSGNGSDPVGLIVYESANYAQGYPDGHALCFQVHTNYSTLVDNLKHVGSPCCTYQWWPAFEANNVCYGQLSTSYGTWNDCISSIKMSTTCHWTADFYLDSFYGSYAFSMQGVQSISTVPVGQGNAISSIKLTYNTVCPASP